MNLHIIFTETQYELIKADELTHSMLPETEYELIKSDEVKIMGKFIMPK